MTTSADGERERAMTPEDIPRLFMAFVAAGDYDGLATLYEEDAVLALPPGSETRGDTAIAQVFAERFRAAAADASDSAPDPDAPKPELQPVLRNGDLAVTSTRMPDGRVTAEVARRQPDGSWRWVIDNPAM